MAPADLIVINGKILTMDPLFPRVEALAVSKGRIIALGTTDEIWSYAGRNTKVIDAGGRMVLPGFQDTHIHLQDSGHGYGLNANLETARSVAELQNALKDFAVRHKGAWVNGVGWYTGIFTDHNLTRQVLDEVVPDRPCYILASDGHNACLNSSACKAVGLERGTPDPFNGHFVLDDGGVPTGMLHEDAIDWARKRMPAITDADYAEGVRFAQALCNRNVGHSDIWRQVLRNLSRRQLGANQPTGGSCIDKQHPPGRKKITQRRTDKVNLLRVLRLGQGVNPDQMQVMRGQIPLDHRRYLPTRPAQARVGGKGN